MIARYGKIKWSVLAGTPEDPILFAGAAALADWEPADAATEVGA